MATGTITYNGTHGGIRLTYNEVDNATSQTSTISITGIEVMSTTITSATTFHVGNFTITLGNREYTLDALTTTASLYSKNVWYTVVSGSTLVAASFANNGRTTARAAVTLTPLNEDGSVAMQWPYGSESDIVYLSQASAYITLIPYVYNVASSIKATSPVNLGASTSITITSVNSAYVHTLSYSVDRSTWTTIRDVTGDATSGKTVTWNTSPLVSYFQTATRVTCYLQCVTYSDSNKSSVIGANTTSITVSATDGPIISSITVTPVNTNTTISGWNSGNIFVQGYTTMRIVVNYTLQTGTTLSRCKIYIGGSLVSDGTATSFSTTSPINDSGTIKISAILTDSRGNTGENEAYISVYKYSAPMLTSFSAIRYSTNVNTEDNENGTNLSAKGVISISSVNGYNSGGVRVRYKLVSDGAYPSTYTTLTSGNSNHVKINSSALSLTQSYIVQFLVYDSLHPVGTSPVAYEVVIPTRSVVIHSRDGGGGVALGGYNDANAIQLWLDTVLYGKLIVPSQMYDTADPTTTGAQVGQVYFKLVD